MKRIRFNFRSETWGRYGPALRLAVISLILCGLVFPLVITGFAQVLFPSQANGSLVQINGKTVGSNLIAQQFNSSIFFHPRNATLSASGVDPDITVQDAYSQIPRISVAANVSIAALQQIVNRDEEGTFWMFGIPYVNVLRLNLDLIQTGNTAYRAYPK
ncbi:MAG TPA: potassium-transporting ATPase subunit C [Candidatus Bathyarchaeia archaeon]|jgi:K+-transporting ATPase ATPase C chain|nr:potassium-transporting ATPase subunit C [Candidatus Bathyarchaeia archaeon]